MKSSKPPYIKSSSIADCGPSCLRSIIAWMTNADAAREVASYGFSARGTSLGEMVKVLREHRLDAEAVSATSSSLLRMKRPAIVILDNKHYVILYEFANGFVRLLDPSDGYIKISEKEFSQRYSGSAILVRAPSSSVERPQGNTSSDQLTLRSVFGLFDNLFPPAAQIFGLMTIGQMMLLASPLILKMVIDRVLPSGDFELLWYLSALLGALTIFGVFITLIRQRSQLNLSTEAALKITDSAVAKLLSLPLDWFDRRSVGDILSRVQSVGPIQQLITQNLAQTVLDTTFIILVLLLMIWLSPMLAIISIIALSLMIMFRIIFVKFERREEETAIVLRAHEQSLLIESVQGIPTIKASNAEIVRHSVWRETLEKSASANVKVSRIRFWNEAFQGLISGLENVVVIVLATISILRGELTIGVLFAYLAYKAQFISKGVAISGQIAALKMLGLHLERLSEITSVKSVPLSGFERSRSIAFSDLVLKDISFSYGRGHEPVFERLNFSISKGDWIIITGPTGLGKTTLLKVCLGLLEATDGAIVVDGRSATSDDLRLLRECASFVLQGDYVFSGKIGDVICGFEPKRDLDRMRTAAESAVLLDEIERMPMKFDTEVGEGGSLLSGGQRQRLQIARALYREPELLLLDEASSHLDPETEQNLFANLRKLPISVLAIAHRMETISFFGKRYQMTKSGLVERALKGKPRS